MSQVISALLLHARESHAMVSLSVRFHSVECCWGWQTFSWLWMCSAALTWTSECFCFIPSSAGTQADRQTNLSWCNVHLLVLPPGGKALETDFQLLLLPWDKSMYYENVYWNMRVCFNLLRVSFHFQHVCILRYQQPAPAVSVGLESAQPDYSKRTPLLSSQP